jgi:DNA-binding NtrC family response regulator
MSAKNNKKPPKIPEPVYQRLIHYHYPGNIRELRALITDAVIANKSGELSLAHFEHKLLSNSMAETTSEQAEAAAQTDRQIIFPRILPNLKQLKNILYEEALRRTNNNKKMAAQLLGISRQAMGKRQDPFKITT